MFVIDAGGNEAYTDDAYQNDIALGAQIRDLRTAAEISSIFPKGVPTASFDGFGGYLNLEGGWAFSSQGVQILLDRVQKLGARVLAGKAVVDLLKQDGKTSGVVCADGSSYAANLVVIASGSWTPSTFPSLPLYGKCVASGLVRQRYNPFVC